MYFIWGEPRRASRLYFPGRNSPPVASGSVAARAKGRKENILTLPFYLGRNKNKKYNKYKTHNSLRLVQS